MCLRQNKLLITEKIYIFGKTVHTILNKLLDLLENLSYRRLGNFGCRKNIAYHLKQQKLKERNIFCRINGVSSGCRVVIETKIKPLKNLTDNILPTKNS